MLFASVVVCLCPIFEPDYISQICVKKAAHIKEQWNAYAGSAVVIGMIVEQTMDSAVDCRHSLVFSEYVLLSDDSIFNWSQILAAKWL